MEGVGSEVEVVSLLCLGVFLFVMFRLWRTEGTNRIAYPRIHPEHQTFIEEVRNSVAAPRAVGEDGGNQNAQSAGNIRELAMLEDDATCPVCLELFIYPIMTNCGHTFCARCFVAYWNHRHWVGVMKCPVCRQDVRVLLTRSLVGDAQQQRNSTSEGATENLEVVRQYNRRFSGDPRSWWEHLQDAPVLIRHLATEFFSVGGLLLMFRVRVFLCVLAAFVYLLLPLDILPEAVFGFLGLLDDLFVGGLVVIYLSILYRQYLAER